MRDAKVWLLAACVLIALAGAALLTTTGQPTAEAEEQVPMKDHWRFHDGRWNYWHTGDNRWYYTDGMNWYFYDKNAWHPYRFDAQFGRDAFERGTYQLPHDALKLPVPSHGIYQPR